MAKKGKSSGKDKYRSAISGRYVTEAHSKRSPKTTVKEQEVLKVEAASASPFD